MINFSTLQSLTIPEGVVTQITDAQGRVLWVIPVANEPVVLEVAKITSNTYANSTSYTGESFILLDIYPKTNGTVTVTYGGLTKTITDTSGAAEPSAQKVYFGTFNGVSDSVETPSSGTLMIEGDYIGVAIGTYNSAKSTAGYCRCITGVTSLGCVTTIPKNAFNACVSLTSVTIPAGVTSIGERAFNGCTSLTSVTIPASVTSVAGYAFGRSVIVELHISDIGAWCGIDFDGSDSNPINFSTNVCLDGRVATNLVIPDGVTEISSYAFCGWKNLISATIPAGVTIIPPHAFNGCTSLTSVTISDGVTNIRAYAFYLCTNLTSVTIPASVTDIQTRVFYDIETITMLSASPPEIASDTFSSSLKQIIVPAGSSETYKAASNWSAYADYITEVS